MNSPAQQNAVVIVEPPEHRHSNMVRELAKPGADITAYITPHEAHLLHMAVGLMGEVVELFASVSDENFIEECGDIEFYFVGYMQGLGLTHVSLPELDMMKYFQEVDRQDLECLLIEAGNLLDQTKKYVIYKKPLDTAKLTDILMKIKALMATVYEGMETSRDVVLTANLWKLREGPNARYGKQYSDQAAQARVDKAAGE